MIRKNNVMIKFNNPGEYKLLIPQHLKVVFKNRQNDSMKVVYNYGADDFSIN